MAQQIATFEELFPHVQPHGVYLCEDLHTSYWHRWGGGYKKRGSFIEYSKNWIDALHAWHTREPRRLRVSDFTRSAHSLHYYDSVVVVEKRPMAPPTNEATGETLSEPDYAMVPPQRHGRASAASALKAVLAADCVSGCKAADRRAASRRRSATLSSAHRRR